MKFMLPQLTSFVLTCAAFFATGTMFVSAQDTSPATSQSHEALTQLEPGFIRTPVVAPTPRISGAGILGIRPGQPFFYRISATGDRPMELSADHVSDGLNLGAHSGIITGSVAKIGK